MVSFNRLVESLQEYFIGSNIPDGDDIILSNRIKVYDGEKKLFLSNTYIASVKSDLPKKSYECDKDTIMLIADCNKNTSVFSPNGMKYVLFSCNVTLLINTYTSLMYGDDDEAQAFLDCWDRIMRRSLHSTRSITEVFEKLPKKISGFVRSTVFSFDNPLFADYDSFISSLQLIFPESNIIKYEQLVLLLQCFPERINRFSPEEQVFESVTPLLEQYSAYALIGNCNRKYESIRTGFITCKHILSIAILMSKDSGQRLFYREDYLIDYVMEVFIKHYKETEGLDDALIITNPAAINLMRYDQQNGTRLMDLVYYYILFERSTTLTAEKMFMHRNTVLAQIKKAESIMNEDLDIPVVRRTMLYSIEFLKYYGKRFEVYKRI